MSKLLSLVLIVTVSSVAGAVQGTQEKKMFSRYKAVEGYEIRHAVLAIPRYSGDGQLCEIGLERLHYMPEELDVDSGLSRAEIDQIVDEFFPGDTKGRRLPDMGLTAGVGLAAETIDRYENVTIRYDYPISPSTRHKGVNRHSYGDFGGYTVAVITWNHRKCQ